jgi:hypothetical protein
LKASREHEALATCAIRAFQQDKARETKVETEAERQEKSRLKWTMRKGKGEEEERIKCLWSPRLGHHSNRDKTERKE